MGTERQRRRAAAAREIEARRKAEEQRAAWIVTTTERAAADPLSPVRAAAQSLLTPAVTPEAAATALKRSFPAVSDGELLAASREAYALNQAAVEAAVQVREHELTDDEALQRLSRAMPGFTVEAYQSALGAGLFTTR